MCKRTLQGHIYSFHNFSKNSSHLSLNLPFFLFPAVSFNNYYRTIGCQMIDQKLTEHSLNTSDVSFDCRMKTECRTSAKPSIQTSPIYCELQNSTIGFKVSLKITFRNRIFDQTLAKLCHINPLTSNFYFLLSNPWPKGNWSWFLNSFSLSPRCLVAECTT